jgi:hypothetical protein
MLIEGGWINGPGPPSRWLLWAALGCVAFWLLAGLLLGWVVIGALLLCALGLGLFGSMVNWLGSIE